MKKHVLKKGYLLRVTSWENDGDYGKTIELHFDSLEKVTAVVKLCENVFVSCNNGEGGIGNSFEEYHNNFNREKILSFMKENPILYDNTNNLSNDRLVEICMEYNDNLMGGSIEGYYSRVFENYELLYISEDVYVEQIII